MYSFSRITYGFTVGYAETLPFVKKAYMCCVITLNDMLCCCFSRVFGVVWCGVII